MKEISKGQTTGRRKKKITKRKISQFSLVTQLCLTICDKPTQTHVHCVSGAIQPSHPLSSLSPPTFNVSQHQGLFQWVGSSYQGEEGMKFQSIGISASASVLPTNIQDWFSLGWTGWISLQSKGLSKVFSNTTVQKHLFFSAQLSLRSNSHIHTWPLEK